MPLKDFKFEHAFEFTQAQVEQFAEVTGDRNPIHLDSNYAATTSFKRPIMHGFLSGSVFSKVFGTIYPGEGTIYMEQSMSFKRPMYAGQSYVAKFVVSNVDADRGRITIECAIDDSEGKVCLQGTAVLMNKSLFNG